MTDLLTLSCRAILFDLDGTLIDSTAHIRRLWQWWAARRGVDFQSLANVMHGRTAVEIIGIVAPHLVPQDEIDALEAEEVTDMYDVRLLPGALQLLAALDGAPWAIVTSGSARVAHARITHVSLPPPSVLVTADQIQNGKPAPDGYLLAARQLGIPPRDCIVIEDAAVGVAAGKAAGMRVIAILGPQPPETFRAADALVSRLTNLRVAASPAGIVVRVSHAPAPDHE